MKVLLAIFALLGVILLIGAIIVETLQFLFSVGIAVLLLAIVVLAVRLALAKR